MTQQLLNLGSGPNTHTGDNLPTMGGKVNANFSDLYSGAAPASNGGTLRSVVTGVLTLASNTATNTTLSVPNLTSSSTIMFQVPDGGDAWARYFKKWIVVASRITGPAGSFTLGHPLNNNPSVVLNYMVTI